MAHLVITLTTQLGITSITAVICSSFLIFFSVITFHSVLTREVRQTGNSENYTTLCTNRVVHPQPNLFLLEPYCGFGGEIIS